MTLRETRCPSCGAPMAPEAFTGAHLTCRFCGAGVVVAPAVATAAAITIERVGQPMIEVIALVRRFSGLGLAEVRHGLGRLRRSGAASPRSVGSCRSRRREDEPS